MGLQSDLQMNRRFCFMPPMPLGGSPFRGIFCGAGIMERQRGTQEEGFTDGTLDVRYCFEFIVGFLSLSG